MGHDSMAPANDERRRRVARAVEDWAKQLIDLTGNNQLLYYRTLKRGTLDLSRAEPAAGSSLLSGGVVRLSNLFPTTEEQADRHGDALKRVRTIHAKALTYYEERGIDTLFLAYGMASWTTTSSKSTPAAPVLLRPLKFDPRGAAEADFDVSLHGDWTVNDTLLHLLATEFNTQVDGDSLLTLLDENGAAGAPSPTSLFERLRAEAGEVPDFNISRQLVAGTFAYTKLPMVKDLRQNVDALAEHDLISAIAGDAVARATVRELRARDVDPTQPDYTPPADEFLILDADASQNLAINAALAGEPLIIQGPPGTGKSQTIANLISTMTARGRRVLFVAEKRAAIDAVTKRLRRAGLGDLVMDLHGGVTSKRQLASELARTLDQMARIPRIDVTDLHDKLVTTRSALTHYAQALHETREPWGVSIYHVNERLIGLGQAPTTALRFAGSRLEDIDAHVAREAREHLVEWSRLAEPLITGHSPWTGAAITTDSDAQEVLDLVDGLAHDTVPDARAELDRVLAETALPPPESVDEWQRTLALLTSLSATLSTLETGIFELDLDDTLDALAPGGRGWWSRMTAQLFDSRYRNAKRSVRELWRGDDTPNGRQLHDVVTEAQTQANEWQALGGDGTPRLPEHLQAAANTYQQLTDKLAALGAYLVTRDLTRRPHRELKSDIAALLSDQQTLFRLPRIHQLEDWLTRYHLGPLMQTVREGDVDTDKIVDVFDHAWLSSIRTQVSVRDPRLANFDGTLQDQRVDEFRKADQQHLNKTAVRVRRAVAEQATRVRNQHSDQDQLVRKEANKKRRHMTLRALFEAAPDVLTALRPCWTMSPLAVSQTLPAQTLFDIVVFDEASQVLPADAVPALLRAPLAVVAGDRRQLPPTTFFDSTVDSDDGEDEDAAALTVGFESILDVLDALLANRMLAWHYRSEDERLIAFSNHNIYDSGLITFPGTFGDDCLTHELIEHRRGVRIDTRSNDFEVQRVVELMIEHARERRGETLGVIAMGQHHATRIDGALRERIAEVRDSDVDAFFDESAEERAFVKSSRTSNVSKATNAMRSSCPSAMAAGRWPAAVPLRASEPRGRRTSAQCRGDTGAPAAHACVVVQPHRHGSVRSSAEGVELLRRYLKYAESGAVDLDGAEAKTPLNPFEIDVKYRLEQAGLTVIPQYGTSGFRIDFALPHPTNPGRLALAVEADGASYHSAPTARDRDRLRQQVLERLGWRFHRIWSIDWFNDPQAETDRALTAFKQAVAEIDDRQHRTIEPDNPTDTAQTFSNYERPRDPDGTGAYRRSGRAARSLTTATRNS